MKIALILAVIVFGAWLWRSNRRVQGQDDARAHQVRSQAQAMVACRHCGLHLPSSEAVKGPHGVYCSQEHRASAQD